MTTHIKVYRAKDGFRWRAKRGSRIVAEGGEAYHRKAGLLKSLKALLASVRDGKYEIAADY